MKKQITGRDGKVRTYDAVEREGLSERDRYILDSPHSTRVLAEELGMSQSTISRIRRGVDRLDDRVVYFIEGDGLMKIGKTAGVASRLVGLQCGSPVPLTLRMTKPGYTKLEADLHAHFADRHSHGEWFQVTMEDVEAYFASRRQ